MKIIVNGKCLEFEKSTICDLVKQYKLSKIKYVIEKNGEIINRDRYIDEELKEGDVVEIVRFVGGG